MPAGSAGVGIERLAEGHAFDANVDEGRTLVPAQVHRLRDLARHARGRVAAHARGELARAREAGFEALAAEQAAYLADFWAAGRRRDRRRRRAAAGRALQPVPACCSRRAGTAGPASPPRASRARATRATTSGTPRSTSLPFFAVHQAGDRARRCCSSATTMLRQGARSARARDGAARARCTRGARSTARRLGLLTRPAPRSTTSTPTSRTRSSSYVAATGDVDFLRAARAPRSWSRPRGIWAGPRLLRPGAATPRSASTSVTGPGRVHGARQQQPATRT